MLGLSEGAWDVLDELCTLDYMGAAEYEFGTLPRKLSDLLDLAKADSLRSFAFALSPGERKLSYERQSHYFKSRKPLPPAQTVCVYGFGRDTDLEAIQERIRILAWDREAFHVKCGTRLADSLDRDLFTPDQDPVMGWIELDNLFMFFSNQSMWEGFCALFNVPLCPIPEVPIVPDYSRMAKKELCLVAVNLGVVRTKSEANKLSKNDLLAKLQPSPTA
jgi:hypothetical protein